ncbi:MAG TPA: alcohol dehydrogenase [Sphaerochaeta sp.]|nr:alcohol dehydrogenase [Sphaerochaeta sp.]HCS36106.1 alcohol dehydrogenase [Sphaerochaeta sp.]
MLRQVMLEPGVIEFENIPVPKPKAGQLVVKMLRIGVCGSDIHVNHGMHPYTSYPVTQGHEVSAVVHEIGPDVSGFAVGDLVTIQPQVVCGECYPCTHGEYHICDSLKVMGFQTTGMASEFFLTDAQRVLKLPAGMTPDEGAMVEPVAVACHALGRVPTLEGLNVLVLGAGPIGNLVAQSAKGFGSKSVMISDISDQRLDKASDVGIDFTINPMKKSVGDALVEKFGSSKADVIFECVGAQATIDTAVSNARKGTTIVIVGVFGERPVVDLGYVQDRELKIVGTAMYQTNDYLKAIELIENGTVKLFPLMTKHFPFMDYKKAYTYIDANKDESMKVFIDIAD